MDFADEDYRRLYTRRTVSNKRLGWEGRAVLHEMLYEFDRAGVFSFSGDPAEDVSLATGLPIEVARVGLERLLKTQTFVRRDSALVWPNFVEAQTCRRSDRHRKQESRTRRRDEAMTAGSPLPVTNCPPVSETVTSVPSEAEAQTQAEAESDAGEAPTVTVRQLVWFVPDSWEPNDRHRVRCQELRLDTDGLLRAFRMQEFNRQYSDWDRRFSKWIEDERIKLETSRGKTVPGLRAVAGADLDTTGAATVFTATSEHDDFCRRHKIDLLAAIVAYRRGTRPAALGTVQARDDFLNRLRCWAATGTFHPDGPLPRPPAKAKEATA